MPVTLKDLASLANVSPATVSLALRGSKKIKLATRKKIKDIADKLGYTPCPQAVGLKSQRSSLIAYLLTDIEGSFFNKILKGINSRIVQYGYGLMVAIATSPEEQEEQLKLFFNKRIEGLIISGNYGSHTDLVMQIEQKNIPVVSTVAEYVKDLSVSSVNINNYKGGCIAAKHLIELGHSHLLWATCDREMPSRYMGVLETAQKYKNIKVDKSQNLQQLKQVMSSKDHPTGIICYSDIDAIKIRYELEELELRVPEDVSLVGFDDIDLASMKEFNFTTVAQPQEKIGQIALELLNKRINGNMPEHVELEPELIIRSSTAAI